MTSNHLSSQVNNNPIAPITTTGTGPAGVTSSPSYSASQFSTLIQRQQRRQGPGVLKLPPVTDKPNDRILRPENFAGWGETIYLDEVGKEEEGRVEAVIKEDKRKNNEGVLSSWRATGVIGPAVAGSPFYAFPAVVSVASIYSPISLLLATLLLPLFQPILVSLTTILPISGATYNYPLLLSRTRHLSLLTASFTILDDISTSVVSAATGASYVLGQISNAHLQEWVVAGVIIIGVGLLSLTGLRAGSGVGLTLLAFHLMIILAIFVSSIVWWARNGSSILISNWHQGQPSAGTSKSIVAAIVKGVCIAFLGVTGYETSPDFFTSLSPNPRTFPRVLTSLQTMAVAVNAPLLLMAFVVLPIDRVRDNGSLLNDLAQKTVGKGLSLLVTIDAVGILSAGVLTGIVSACALFKRLADDGVLPTALLKQLPLTHAPAYSIALFTGACLLVYASSGANLSVMSSVFALVFLSIMFLFPFCSLLLSYHFPRFPTPNGRAYSPPRFLTPSVLLLAILLIIGNVVLYPLSLAYFVAYVGVIVTILLVIASRNDLLKVLSQSLEGGAEGSRRKALESRLKDMVREGKEGARIIFVESDEVSRLMEMVLFIRRNERTNRIKLVHCYRDIEEIPKEMEANHRILDEAFPAITIDLIFIQANFTPSLVHAISTRLNVPRSRCFMGCPSEGFPYGIEEFRGVRIIAI